MSAWKIRNFCFSRWIVLFAAIFLASCVERKENRVFCQDQEDCRNNRGQILEKTLLSTISKEDSESNDALLNLLLKAKYPTVSQLLHNVEYATFDYDVMFERVVYQTIDPNGQLKKVSAVVVSPIIEGDFKNHEPKPLISYQHLEGEQPSKFKKLLPINTDDLPSLAGVFGWLFASKGYTFVAGDQIDYGLDSEVYLQYSSGHAVLDLIKAVRHLKATYPNQVNWSFNDKNILMGYSQGGFDSISANRLAESQNVVLADVYAGGAPYDLYNTFLNVADIELGNAKNSIIDMDEQFKRFKKVLKGYVHYFNFLPQDIATYLDVKTKTYKTNFLKRFKSGSSPLVALLKRQTLSFEGMKTTGPDNKIHLYHSPDDRLVSFENFSEVDSSKVASKNVCGYPLRKVPKGALSHESCFLIFVNSVYEQLVSAGIYSPGDLQKVGTYFLEN